MTSKRISWHARVPIELAVSMLEPTLGWDKSVEVVEATAKELGLAGGNLSLSQILRIFEALGERPDLVGVAARFARTRLEGNASRTPRTSERPPEIPSSRPPSAAPPARRISVGEVIDLLTPALGLEKSASLVAAAGAELGISVNNLDMTGALAIIDRLADNEGLVGVVAKYARVQIASSAPSSPTGSTKRLSGAPPPAGPSGGGQESVDGGGMGRLDQLAHEAGVTWVEWLHEDYAERKVEPPSAFPETHHGARAWLMRALPRASRESLREVDIDRMVRILFESARREWEGTTSSQV